MLGHVCGRYLCGNTQTAYYFHTLGKWGTYFGMSE